MFVLLALFCLSLANVPSTFAADSPAPPLSALTFRMAGDDLRTRVVVMFDREPKLSTRLFGNPHRLVIDLPETRFGFDEKALRRGGLFRTCVMAWRGRGVRG
ncbi:N-acetylmuramoyl-l-alanine amidase domain protein [Brucella neotomae 5K33]|nr:N-acetylmuramoyl-l-alanine amidase domain protein [Brucella neotomae 5K33]